MSVNKDDLTHPKNHYCDHCKSPAGTWCVTATGKIRNSFEKQHVNRHLKADEARGGILVAGIVIEGTYLANGYFVPTACKTALQELNQRWPGASLPQAQGAIIQVVIDSYFKCTNPN